ncbi:MAG: hypothetical protein ACOZQL_15830 [Myxococcota bacterium]
MSIATRVERKKNDGPKVLGFPERVSLFVTALHKQRATELFEGLAAPLAKRARAFNEVMGQWDSARRQARLAHEFGVRPDAGEQVQQLVVRTNGELRAAIVASLPPAIRRQFPQFQGGVESFPMVVRAVAARLVKEASR